MVEKIIWSNRASQNFDFITEYLITNWGEKVLKKFKLKLEDRLSNLKHNPNIGYKSSKNSIYQKTLITDHYLLVYRYSKNIITIIRIKHRSQNK